MRRNSSLLLDASRGHGFSRATLISSPICHSEGTSVSEESARSRSGLHRLAARLKSCCTLATAMLREIFDESAYSRFLVRQQIGSSQTAYAQFLREQEVAKARRPRCC